MTADLAQAAAMARLAGEFGLRNVDPYGYAVALLGGKHLPGEHSQATHGGGGGAAFGAAAVTGAAAHKSVAYKPSDAGVKAAINDYGGEGPNSYANINSGLRGGSGYATELDPAQQANVDGLDRAMREAKGAPTDLLVHRTADPESLGIDRFAYHAGDHNDLTGITWQDKGFVSTATDGEWAKDSSRVVMRIVVPKGTKAISSDGLDADEILLDRGLTFRVIADHGFAETDYKGDPNPYSARNIDVEVVP